MIKFKNFSHFSLAFPLKRGYNKDVDRTVYSKGGDVNLKQISLKAMRVDAELTQKDAANALNCSIDKIKYIEGEGGKKVSYNDLKTLTELYGFEIADVRLPDLCS